MRRTVIGFIIIFIIAACSLFFASDLVMSWFKKTPAPIIAKEDFTKALESSELGGYKLTTIALGDLEVPTGRIVVGDPLASPEMPPLVTRIPKGRYPVSIVMADTGDFGDRIALAVLQVRNDSAIRYEMTHNEMQDMSTLKEGWIMGFPVDAGMGFFADEASKESYLTFLEQFDGTTQNVYDDYFAERLRKVAKEANHSRTDGDWLNWYIPHSEGHNLVMFASGYGDGYYPVYVGKNTKGDTVNILIDFQVLFEPEE